MSASKVTNLWIVMFCLLALFFSIYLVRNSPSQAVVELTERGSRPLALISADKNPQSVNVPSPDDTLANREFLQQGSPNTQSVSESSVPEWGGVILKGEPMDADLLQFDDEDTKPINIGNRLDADNPQYFSDGPITSIGDASLNPDLDAEMFNPSNSSVFYKGETLDADLKGYFNDPQTGAVTVNVGRWQNVQESSQAR